MRLIWVKNGSDVGPMLVKCGSDVGRITIKCGARMRESNVGVMRV